MQKPKSNAFFRMNLALPYTRNDAQLELHVGSQQDCMDYTGCQV